MSPETVSPGSLRAVVAKLIFNPAAGVEEESPFQLTEILTLLEFWHIIPEVHIVTPESNITAVVSSALRRGIRLFIVSGGDGTIESMIGPLVGTQAVLGIIPTGTRNNVALSLGIPSAIDEAVELLRRGHRTRIDVGRARCGQNSRWFLETCSIGLVPALYPAADDIQHGNLARIADFLSTLVVSQPAELHLILDGEETVTTMSHVALAANMPYFGANINVSPLISFQDNWLDVFVFSELTKLELVSYAVQVTGGAVDDPRILHYRARQITMQATPDMPVMADGFSLGFGTLTADLRPLGLNVITGLGQPQGPQVGQGRAGEEVLDEA